MAQTIFSTSNALTKKAWEEELFRETRIESYFEKFMGGKDAIVHEQRKLEKEQGDEITFGLIDRLSGDGVEDDDTLEGNEEDLSSHDYSIVLKQYRHAVKDNGALTRKRAMFSITDESKAALKIWMSEKIDKLIFAELDDDCTQNAYVGGSSSHNFTATAATAKSGVAASQFITPDFLMYVGQLAKFGKGRTFLPIRAVKVNGKKYYVLLVHPSVAYDLKVNSDFKQALREAEVRGPTNPLFNESTAIWGNVVVHEHENCTTGSDGGGASVFYGLSHLLGAQSVCWAWGKRVSVNEKEFDYGNKMGHSIAMISRAGRPQFNSLDYGSMNVYTAATNLAA